jgi:hypothetical protein
MHHFLCVLLHFVTFLCIFWNKPINEMPQCQFPVICYFCVSEKLHRIYSQNWTEQKPKFLFFLTRDGVQSRDGGGPEGGHTPHGAGHPLAASGHGVGPWSTSWHHHSAYIFSSIRNPKARSIFQKTYYKPPPSSMRDRNGPEALPGILSERGITTGGLLHHHTYLRSDVSVVYLGLRVHSSI